MHPHDKSPQGWVLDLRESEVLSAWRTVAERLKAYCQPGGLASLLLNGGDAKPNFPIKADTLLLQTQIRLPILVSSTREIDIFGAMNAALPLIVTSQESTSSWRNFLTGYACGLKTSPSLDIQRERFLGEFDNAVMVAASHCYATRLDRTESASADNISPWTHVVLEAISYGSTTLAALLAQRAISADSVSGADTIFGALLGSALWRDCPYESDLIGRLCGSGSQFYSFVMRSDQ